MSAVLHWWDSAEGQLHIVAAAVGWLLYDVIKIKRQLRAQPQMTHIGLPGGVLTINGPVTADEVAEFQRRLGRCGDRSPTLHSGAVPSRCVLDVGHTGSHTDGRGCEWMYDKPEATP